MSKACDCLLENCKHRQVAKIEETKSRSKVDIKHLKARSQDQERNIARLYKDAGFPKSRRVPMSGALQELKADVDPGEFYLIEAKETRSGKLVINPDWINKVRSEAKSMGRDYVLHGWCANGPENFTKVVVLDESVFMKITSQLQAFQSESVV